MSRGAGQALTPGASASGGQCVFTAIEFLAKPPLASRVVVGANLEATPHPCRYPAGDGVERRRVLHLRIGDDGHLKAVEGEGIQTGDVPGVLPRPRSAFCTSVSVGVGVTGTRNPLPAGMRNIA